MDGGAGTGRKGIKENHRDESRGGCFEARIRAKERRSFTASFLNIYVLGH